MLQDKLTVAAPQMAISPLIRANFILENNKRSRVAKVRVTGLLTVTTIGTLIRNLGSVLGAIATIGLQQGSYDQVNVDARLLRHYSEYNADGPIPAVRLTVAQAGALGAYPLMEEVYMAFANPWTASPSETYFKEDNVNNQLQVFIQQGPAGIAQITDALGTLTLVSAVVTQVYDEQIGLLPLFVPFLDTVEVPVPGPAQNLRLDLKGSDYLAMLIFQQDTSLGEVADIINSMTVIGDGINILGQQQIPWTALVDGMVYESGGAGSALASGIKSWFAWNFVKSGRLSSMLPPNSIPNLRALFNAQPSALAGSAGSTIRALRVWYRRDMVVCQPVLPFDVTG